MKSLICLITLITCFSALATAKPIVIAVIDTGLGAKQRIPSDFLCKYGHRDFTTVQKFSSSYGTKDPVPTDTHGHGTNIAGVIREHAKKTGKDFCLVILKYYDPTQPDDSLKNEVAAIRWATTLKADIINFSSGGYIYSSDEYVAVKKYIDNGGTFVAAAGNENNDLGVNAYFPACDDKRIIVVGNYSRSMSKSPQSNFGKRVNRWEYGENVTGFNLVMTGTSQACAVATGKIVGEKNFSRDTTNKSIAIRK